MSSTDFSFFGNENNNGLRSTIPGGDGGGFDDGGGEEDPNAFVDSPTDDSLLSLIVLITGYVLYILNKNKLIVSRARDKNNKTKFNI
ncbi:MAG: hypothetical protein LBN11_03955 [Tannerella sp.]|jgi:hypothetical protein|nr:hypothetical protein [Tannerella sp.]